MEKFIVVYDEAHRVMAGVTEELPLLPRRVGRHNLVLYDLDKAMNTIPDLYLFISKGHQSEDVLGLTPEEKWLWAKDRRYPDITKVDMRCWDTHRLQPSTNPNSLLSAEVILYGVGVLRRYRDMGLGIYDRFRKVFGVIECPGMISREFGSCYPFGHFGWLPETWESTNLIYGDIYGELLQLHARRYDFVLLGGLVQTLRQFHDRLLHRHRNGNGNLHESDLMRGHYFRDCQWCYAPQNLHELVARVDFILENCSIDRNPQTVCSER